MKLAIPTAALNQHLIVLGKTGAGKSSALRHLVEHLLHHDKRVVIIDPKGDWWGLKSAADGKHAGFSVVAFGDFKEPQATDVPINPQSGGQVAELITSGNRPAIIGFRGWMTSHMVQFWIDFAAGVFNGNAAELFVVGDEFHNFAPKGKIMDPQAGKCLHWSNRLLAEGRGIGITCLLASQRPQKVHNDTLTSCETLVAMRVVHAADRKAIEDWIKGCGDVTHGKEVLATLAAMPRGQAWVWSPEIDFGPKQILFPMFETFDSFAPPQLQKRISNKGWATVDLEAVREKLAAVIEKARLDDPKELRKQIADLQKQLRTAPQGTIKVTTVEREVPVLKDGQLQRIESLSARVGEMVETFAAAGRELKIIVSPAINHTAPTVSKPATPVSPADWGRKFEALGKQTPCPHPSHKLPTKPNHPPAKPSPPPPNDGSITPRQQRFLDAAAALTTLNTEVTRETVCAWVGVHPRGGSVGEELKALADAGLISLDRGRIAVTDAGQAAAGHVDPAEAIDRAKSGLTNRQAKFFDVIVAAYPEPVTREAIAEQFGIHPRGGSLGEDLGRLVGRGLVTVNRGQYMARDFLFAR